MNSTLTHDIPKAAWIDRCVMSIGKLRPEISLQEAQTVAMNILWSDAVDKVPEDAAAAWVDAFQRR